MLKRLRAFWVGAGVLAVTVGGALYHQVNSVLDAPLVSEHDEALVIQVPSGSHFQGVIRQLQTLSLIDHPFFWRAYGRLVNPQLKAGEYFIRPGQTWVDSIAQMRQGRVRLHSLTVVEGWTIADFRRRLAREPKLTQVATDWSNQRLMEALGCEGCFAEGHFMPETYLYTRGDSDLSILERAHQSMQRVLDDVWAQRDETLPIDTPQGLLILASLIEKETALERERGTIAGVFARRLQRGMRLQTDPTVIYGLDATYNGDLTRTHLRTDHPWNTYTRHGLPATPIALPSRASLLAASQPEAGQALYFVARGDGSHQFSATLDAHNRAVNRYIRGHEK